MPSPSTSNSSSSISYMDDTEYEIEDILRVKRLGETYMFFVKWKEYPVEDCTWEPEENLIHLSFFRRKMLELKRALSREEAACKTKKNIGKGLNRETRSNTREIGEAENSEGPRRRARRYVRNSARSRPLGSLGGRRTRGSRTNAALLKNAESSEALRDSQWNDGSVERRGNSRAMNRAPRTARALRATGMNPNAQSALVQVPDSANPSMDEHGSEHGELQRDHLGESALSAGSEVRVLDIYSFRMRNKGIQFLASIKDQEPMWVDEERIVREGHVKYKIADFLGYTHKNWTRDPSHKFVIKNLHNVNRHLFVSVGHEVDGREVQSLYPGKIMVELYPREMAEFLMSRIRFI